MRVRSVMALIVTVTALIAIGVAVVTKAEGQSPSPHYFRSNLSDFTQETVRDFTGFPLYSLGPQFEDLPLTAIVRIDQKSTLKA